MANTGMALSQAEMDQISGHFFDSMNDVDGIQGGNVDESRLVKAVRAEKAERALVEREQERATRNAQWDDYYRDEDEDDDSEFYDSEVGFDDLIDENDPNKDVSDLTQPEKDDPYDFDYDNPQDFFYHLPDDVELAPGITKKGILDFKKAQDEFTETANFNKHLFSNMTQINGFSKGLIEKNMISHQRDLAGIERKLAHPSTRPDQKVGLYEDKARLEAKMQVIEQDWLAEQNLAAQRKAAAYDHGFMSTDVEMKRQIGNEWKGNEVWNYAVRNGIPVEALREVVAHIDDKSHGGVALAKIILKAMKNDNFESHRSAKLNKTMGGTNTPKSVSGSKKQAPHVEAETDAKKNYLTRKARKVGLSRDEHIEMYKYLKD